MSVFAGILLYRYTLFQPEVVSSNDPRIQLDNPVKKEAIKFEDFVLTNLSQQKQALNDWKTPFLVINFWAPWCAPCRREIPALIEIQKDYADQLQMLGLSFDSLENVREFKNQYAFNYPLLLVGQQSQQLNQYFGNQSGGLPFTVIMDANREIIYRHSGELDKAGLIAQIQPLL